MLFWHTVQPVGRAGDRMKAHVAGETELEDSASKGPTGWQTQGFDTLTGV